MQLWSTASFLALCLSAGVASAHFSEYRIQVNNVLAKTTVAQARPQYFLVSGVEPSEIPPTPLKKQGFIPPFLRGDRALSKKYWARPRETPESADAPYVPTPNEVVAEMLRVAKVTGNDKLYDLGSGDGRIVIAAAQKYGTRGVGIDINLRLIEQSRENAQKAGVSDRVQFLQQDLFQTDFRDATVVTLYLLPEINQKLRPKLLKELRPGTRIVSHAFNMGEWKPDQVVLVQLANGRPRLIYYWVIPANVAGTWHATVSTRKGEQRYTIQLRQQFQQVSATANANGRDANITGIKLVGDQLSFKGSQNIKGQTVSTQFSGRVEGDTFKGTADIQGGPDAGKYNLVAIKSNRYI